MKKGNKLRMLVCGFLAVALTLGLWSGSPWENKVAAAVSTEYFAETPNKEADNRLLAERTGYGESGDEVVHLIWNLNEDVFAKPSSLYFSGNNDVFTLTYHLKDNTRATLKVNKVIDSETEIQVTYQYERYNTVSDKWEAISMGNPRVHDGYTMSSTLNDPSGGRSFDRTVLTELRFTVKQTYGIYFNPDDTSGAHIAFYLDKDNNFHFTTNQALLLGRYYDFTLDVANKNTHVSYYNGGIKKYIMTGYSNGVSNGFTISRFADDDAKKDNGEYLDTILYTETKIKPAENVGAYVDIAFPDIWDADKNRFVEITECESMNANSSFDYVFEFNSAPNSTAHLAYALQIKDGIPSIVEAMHSGKNTNGDALALRAVYDENFTLGSRRAVRLTIGNLEESKIYQGLYLRVNPSNKSFNLSQMDDTKLGYIATYLRYEILSFGSDEFFIRIKPYEYISNNIGDREGIAGTYTVYGSTSTKYLADGSKNDDANTVQGMNEEDWNRVRLETKFCPSDEDDFLVSLGAASKLGNDQVRWYRIVFSRQGQELVLESQKYRYESDESDIVLPVPEILTESPAITARVVASESGSTSLILSIDWKIGMQNVLSTLYKEQEVKQVDYTFSKGTQPSYNSSYLDYVTVTLHLDRIMGTDPNYKNAITIADSSKEISMVASEKNTVYTTPVMEEGKPVNYVYGHMEISLPTTTKENWVDEPFIYPYLYFTDARAEYEKLDSDGSKKNEWTTRSIPRNITINGLEDIEVTAPQNISVQATSISQTGFQMEWLHLSLTEYENLMLYPKKLGIYANDLKSLDFNNSVKFNVYISKSLANLTKLTDALTTAQEKKNPTSTKAKEAMQLVGEHKINASNYDGTAIDLSKIESLTNKSGQSAIEWLRADNILLLSGLPQDEAKQLQRLLIEQADYNDAYYIVLDASVEPYKWDKDSNGAYIVDENGYPILNPSTGVVADEGKHSKFTKVVSATTKNVVVEPKPEEAVPLAPTNVEKEDATSNKAVISWSRNIPTEQTGYYKYQVLRVWNKRLTAAQEGMRVTALEMLKEMGTIGNPMVTQLVGFGDMLGIKGTAVFDGTDFVLYDNTQEAVEYSYKLEGDKWMFTDITLSPNQIYYYYVRTITINADTSDEVPAAVSYSNWIPISVTTVPVSPPKNLAIEQDLVANKLTETVVSFDAPLTKLQLENKSAYFGISINQDGVELPELHIKNVSDFLSIGSAEDEDYTRYTYNIKGLKAGQIYTIRVRLYDTTLGEWSAYSQTVRTRTEVDQDEYDNEKDTEKWFANLKKQLQELLKNPYWKISDQGSLLPASYIYRASMFDAQLQTTINGAVILAAKDATRQDYYIPAAVLQKNNAANKSFVIENAGMSVTLTANSLSAEATQAIKEASANKNIADYFIKITAHTVERTQELEGNKPASPQIQLSFEVVGTSTTEKKWDQETYNSLYATITDNSLLENAEKTLKTMIEKGATNQELVAYVDKQIKEVEKQVMAEVASSFQAISKKPVTIATLSKPAIVRSSVTNQASVSAYRYDNGLWSSLPTTAMGSTASFSTNTAGTYIFAGKAVANNAFAGLANSQRLSTLVSQYALEDYIGKNLTAAGLQASATGNTVAGVVARLAGAPKTADPYTWLNAKGYKLSQRTATSTITAQEAIYAAMMLYEMKTGTTVDSIRITNFAATAHMNGIDAGYKKSIQAAYQLGFVTDSALQPKDKISILDFLTIIGRMADKVKL